MTRDELVRLANADTWNRSMSRAELREVVALLDAKDARIGALEAQVAHAGDASRDDLREVLPMLDEKDARIRSLEAQLAVQTDVPSGLATELRAIGSVLKDDLDALSTQLERRARV